MADVTYFVALPFIAADDGVAPGEAVECFNRNAAVMRARKQCRANRGMSAQWPSAVRAIRP